MARKKKDEEELEPVEVESAPFFTAKLKLRDIGREFVTYRVHEVVDGVANPREGSDRINIHHVQIDRPCFPSDDDFNLEFINRNLSLETPDEIKEKQANFRRFAEFDLVIR